jgi:hypothetical protein
MRGERGKRSLQLSNSLASAGGRGHDGSIVQKGVPQEASDINADIANAFGVDGVRFGKHYHSAWNTEKSANGKMFFRLRFDAFICGDDQHHAVDTGRTRQHVAHESVVSRDIHDTEVKHVTASIGQAERGKTEIDRDAAPLFFRKAVCVCSG